MKRSHNSIIALAFALSVCAIVLADPVDVQIDRSASRYNLGVSPFETDKNPATTTEFRETLIDDLTFSRLFNLVTDGPVIRKGKDAVAWKPLGPETVLAGEGRVRGDRFDTELHLFDVASTKEVLSIKKKGALYEARVLAHEAADEIVKYFSGQPGIFSSKIAFVNDSTGRKELYLADYDGKNVKRVTSDNSIVILPRISPDGQKVVFTSYRSGNPDLYMVNRDGSNRVKLSSKAGLNVSPSWSPHGQELAVTLSIHSSPNIYLIDLKGNVKQRITDTPGADTAPSFSPDGSQIVFTSDRSGSPHIYVMNIDGSGLRRLTTVGNCDSAAWSPDGQTILYVKAEGRNRYDIYSIEVLTGLERRLTWGGGDNENAVWSPDSRFILFTSNRRGKYELFIMNADGSEQRPLGNLKGQSFTPHWST